MQHSKPRYTLVEAFKLLGISRSKGYLRINEGRLVPTYDGEKPYLTAEEIDRYAGQSHPPIDYQIKARPRAAEQSAA
jgi:hypothetical protein